MDTPTMFSEALPADLVFMEVVHDLFRSFFTEEWGKHLLDTLGVHFASCVVDTNIWLADITRTIKTNKPSGLLQAAHIGTLCLYASTVVRDEVPRKIHERAKSLKIDPEQACHLWKTLYLPCIRFLDLTHLPLSSKLVLELQMRDSDDVAIGQLTEALRPSIVLSLDKKHLGGFAIVSDPVDWTMFAAAYRDSAKGDAMIVGLHLGGGMVVSLSFGVIRLIIAAIARMDKRLLLAIMAGLGAAILFPPTRRLLLQFGQFLLSFAQSDLVRERLQAISSEIAMSTAQALEAKQFLLEKERSVSQPAKALEYMLFALSRAGGALSAAELTRRMIDLGYRPRGENPKRYVRRLLGIHPEWFERDENGQWRITTNIAS